MKKKVALLVAMVLLCNMMVVPASAAEVTEECAPSEEVSTIDIVVSSDDEVTATATGTNYFSKITSKLNSLNGATASSNLSSGSCSGTTRSITKVTAYCRVSSGSSNYNLVITSPKDTVVTQSCGTSSTTYTLTGFNSEDPKGTWNVGIVSKGTVSTVTVTLKVYYSYE